MSSEDFFNRILKQYKDNLPFVAYRKPDISQVSAILQKNSKLFKTSNFTESGFVFAPFNDKEDAVLFPSVECDTIFVEKVILKKNEDSHSVMEEISSTDESYHISLVKKGINAIIKEEFQKVVLSRKEKIPLPKTNPILIFKRLLSSYTSAFAYVWYHPKVGLWLGATPETLLKVENRCFSTMALAGTQQYKGTMDVRWNDKEKKEQQMVTDYIVNNLQSLVKKTHLSETKTVKAGNLLHLQTNISGALNYKISSSRGALEESVNLKQILSMLHPTPAICGLPKKEAKDFILKNENYNRKFYTGFLGEISIKSTILYINLRCMQLKGKEAILYVGGGITKDSIPEKEWEETCNKTETMKRVL